mmetsp:Transcript_50303/g.117464  ORF Transcript_50303/g.117464 Transcript_50303/m.117464 type:complete len:1148 (-) Transcript_50303:40-3483(-)
MSEAAAAAASQEREPPMQEDVPQQIEESTAQAAPSMPGLRFRRRLPSSATESSTQRWPAALQGESSSSRPMQELLLDSSGQGVGAAGEVQPEAGETDSSDSEIFIMGTHMAPADSRATQCEEHSGASAVTASDVPERAFKLAGGNSPDHDLVHAPCQASHACASGEQSQSEQVASALRGAAVRKKIRASVASPLAQGANDIGRPPELRSGKTDLQEAQSASEPLQPSQPASSTRSVRPKPWSRRVAFTQFTAPQPQSWWGQHFEVHRNRVGAFVLRVALPDMKVMPQDVRSITVAADTLLRDLRSLLQGAEAAAGIPLRVSLEVDLTSNKVENAGVVCLCRWLLRHRREVRCRSLRLSDTNLGDDAMLWLAEVIKAQHSALEVLELSHNPITEHGVCAVLAALALHPTQAYPWLGGSGSYEPVRVDLSSTQTPQLHALLKCLKLRTDLRWCDLDSRQPGGSLTIEAAPHVQVAPQMAVGAKDRTSTLSSSLLQFVERLCTEPQSWMAPALTGGLLLPLHPSVMGLTPVLSASGPVAATRRAMLHVDDDAGAGIELDAVSEGLRVIALQSYPGQPDLRVGDVLVAVDAWPLASAACDGDEDKQHDRFGDHFRHGATLDVLAGIAAPQACSDGDRSAGAPRAGGDITFRCPKCLEPFTSWTSCLQHLKTTDHAPPEPPKGSGPKEDTSACLRRWMSACSAAARGEFSGASSTGTAQAVARVKLLRISRLSCSTRCSAVVNHLALECIRCADRHSCCVWIQPHGLELRSIAGDVDFAAVAADLMAVLYFALPDLEDKSEKDGSQSLQAEKEAIDVSSTWTQWMQCMVEQQAGEDLRDDADRAAGGGMSSLRASAAPFIPYELAAQAAPLRLLVLCGLPGSGKSTLAARLRAELGWTIVNQDTLTSREACMKAARSAFKDGDAGKVVIDRCNFNMAQRSPWVQLAIHEFGLQRHELCCVWLDVRAEECNRRVLTRLGHPTLPPRVSSLEVIRRFAEAWQPPDTKEGFGFVRRLTSDIDIETLCAEMRGTPDAEPGMLTESEAVDGFLADVSNGTSGQAEVDTATARPPEVVDDTSEGQVPPRSPSTLLGSEVAVAADEATLVVEPQGKAESSALRAAMKHDISEAQSGEAMAFDFWHVPLPELMLDEDELQ